MQWLAKSNKVANNNDADTDVMILIFIIINLVLLGSIMHISLWSAI